MVWRSMVVFVLSLAASSLSADTYRVRNPQDSGAGSLRWAITQANDHAGRDKILFAARMAGKVIRPVTPLPNITGNRTVVTGDIDGDGTPDVALNGKLLGSGDGLTVAADRCKIIGLAITAFPGTGLVVVSGSYNQIRTCHVGVNLAGTKPFPNHAANIKLDGASDTLIGGTAPQERNIIAGPDPAGYYNSVRLLGSTDNMLIGNHIGITRDGLAALGTGYTGIQVIGGSGNTIGGVDPGAGNVLAGVDIGIMVHDSSQNVIVGNYFGLAADGNKLLPITYFGVQLAGGAQGNRIGGTAAGAGNVFAGGAQAGVECRHAGTDNNRIVGNHFGVTASGTRQRRLQTCVRMTLSAGPQIIGGGTPEAGNYFTAKGSPGSWPIGVSISLGGGAGSLIRHNKFGVRPDGKNATPLAEGIRLSDTSVTITDNVFAGMERYGIRILGTEATAGVFRNAFRGCATAVMIADGAHCRLGNLDNATSSDDGGNRFRPSNRWQIYNETGNRIRAEGNSFGTTSRVEIESKIHDKFDDGALGRVDFIPLMGGVIPTGAASAHLALTGTTAVPTRSGGAEIAFSLSAPADVTVQVMNIAGRPVACVSRDTPAETGPQRLVWSGRSSNGTAAPSGVYLVKITARSTGGEQATALVSLALRR